MEIVLYVAALVAAIAFLILCVSLGMTLFTVKDTVKELTKVLGDIEGQMQGITRETTFLLEKTNSLAGDIQDKSQQLNTVVGAVKGIGESVNGLNNSVQRITSSVATSVETNKDQIAQVVQWSNVAMGIADKWKERKTDEVQITTLTSDQAPKKRFWKRNK